MWQFYYQVALYFTANLGTHGAPNPNIALVAVIPAELQNSEKAGDLILEKIRKFESEQAANHDAAVREGNQKMTIESKLSQSNGGNYEESSDKTVATATDDPFVPSIVDDGRKILHRELDDIPHDMMIPEGLRAASNNNDNGQESDVFVIPGSWRQEEDGGAKKVFDLLSQYDNPQVASHNVDLVASSESGQTDVGEINSTTTSGKNTSAVDDEHTHMQTPVDVKDLSRERVIKEMGKAGTRSQESKDDSPVDFDALQIENGEDQSRKLVDSVDIEYTGSGSNADQHQFHSGDDDKLNETETSISIESEDALRKDDVRKITTNILKLLDSDEFFSAKEHLEVINQNKEGYPTTSSLAPISNAPVDMDEIEKEMDNRQNVTRNDELETSEEKSFSNENEQTSQSRMNDDRPANIESDGVVSRQKEEVKEGWKATVDFPGRTRKFEDADQVNETIDRTIINGGSAKNDSGTLLDVDDKLFLFDTTNSTLSTKAIHDASENFKNKMHHGKENVLQKIRDENVDDPFLSGKLNLEEKKGNADGPELVFNKAEFPEAERIEEQEMSHGQRTKDANAKEMANSRYKKKQLGQKYDDRGKIARLSKLKLNRPGFLPRFENWTKRSLPENLKKHAALNKYQGPAFLRKQFLLEDLPNANRNPWKTIDGRRPPWSKDESGVKTSDKRSINQKMPNNPSYALRRARQSQFWIQHFLLAGRQ